MTSPRKALIRYDLLTAGALGCAALLLVMLFAGCGPAKSKLAARCQAINFYGTESTGYWSMFGADVPASFAAQEMPRRTQDINQTACRRMRSCRLAALGSQSLRAQNRASACCAGRTNIAF